MQMDSEFKFHHSGLTVHIESGYNTSIKYFKDYMPLSDDELVYYNKQGIIPGPEENETDFVKRAQHCLTLKEQMTDKLGDELALEMDNLVSSELIQQTAPITRQLFDVVPTWIPVIFSNQRLAPWHGGCAWIFQFTEETPVAAFFQLRRIFAQSSHYLWIYSREELIAHETAHVGRMLFKEPKFEEVLAYRTAKSFFRSWFGPIVQSAWESVLFIISLFLIFLIDIFYIISPYEPHFNMAWIKALPLILIGVGVARLWRRQRQFAQCLKTLQNLLHDPKKTNAVIYRLQDDEIIRIGRMTPNELLEYASVKKTHSLRWRVITHAYFSNSH